MAFKCIVAGGRDFNDYRLVARKLDVAFSNKSDITVVSGGARGADALGERYAKERGLSLNVVPAEWKTHGKAAGPIRNEEMAKQSDALVAFWDGESRGTKNMVDTAVKHGLKVIVVNYVTDESYRKGGD